MRKYFSAALCCVNSPSNAPVDEENPKVNTSRPTAASGSKRRSPDAPIGGPCPSPSSPWVFLPRLRRPAGAALAACPPATAVGGGVFACGAAAAGGVGAAGTSGGAGGAACGFPTATAGTSGGAGGPPKSAGTSGGAAFAVGGALTGNWFRGRPLGSETAPAKHVAVTAEAGGDLTGVPPCSRPGDGAGRLGGGPWFGRVLLRPEVAHCQQTVLCCSARRWFVVAQLGRRDRWAVQVAAFGGTVVGFR